ncbi:MAG: flagellar type III secretion system pore protein FliP [Candidatus Aminicenantes bacterium]|nr:flagellar type III secretion system pore protein FliP [Candidatus Aminicenantes bacterium]
MMKKTALFILIFLAAQFLVGQTLPSVTISVKDSANQKGELAATVKIALLLTLLTLAPAILMMMTSFTRLIISFYFLRQAMGLQGVPPNQVMIGISLFLTLFIMSPVGLKINETAIKPYNEGKITEMEALNRSTEPIKEFMLRQTREKDLALFYQLSNTPRPASKKDVGMITLIPAFILSELKTAFQIGFLLYIPFLIIDIVVASILVALGMIFLPPIMVSLPFKIVLFIVADGWALLMSSLLRSFNMGGF